MTETGEFIIGRISAQLLRALVVAFPLYRYKPFPRPQGENGTYMPICTFLSGVYMCGICTYVCAVEIEKRTRIILVLLRAGSAFRTCRARHVCMAGRCWPLVVALESARLIM